MEKYFIPTYELLVIKFFATLGKDHNEEAICLFKSAWFDPSNGMGKSFLIRGNGMPGINLKSC